MLLPEPDDSLENRLHRVTVAVIAGDNMESAAAQLDDLISSLPPGDLRKQAVTLRLLAAHDPEVTLDPALGDEVGKGARWP